MNQFSSPCYCINFRRAAGVLSAFYDKSLASARLTTSQFSLMKSLSQVEPCTVTMLADIMGLERTTLVRTMRPLLERKLIHNTASEKSRNKALTLTKEGIALLGYANELWSNAQSEIESYMGHDRIETLMELLVKIESFTGS